MNNIPIAQILASQILELADMPITDMTPDDIADDLLSDLADLLVDAAPDDSSFEDAYDAAYEAATLILRACRPDLMTNR